MAFATSFLPAPLCPRINTVASVRATRLNVSKNASICGATVAISWNSVSGVSVRFTQHQLLVVALGQIVDCGKQSLACTC
jgi:hypothetical protein